MLLLVLERKKGITTFYTMFVYSVRLRLHSTSDGHILFPTAIYYFRLLLFLLFTIFLLFTVYYLLYKTLYTTFSFV